MSDDRKAGDRAGNQGAPQDPHRETRTARVVTDVALGESAAAARSQRLFFGDCEFRVDSGELVSDGRLVRIAPQPSRVLQLLARRSGQVVSRSDLCDSVWEDGTCVDYEEGLNYCIKQLRRALDDDASQPRFIETVHRRGYRFLKPVRVETVAPEIATVDDAALAPGPPVPGGPARLVVLELAEIGRELPYPRFGVTLSEELLSRLTERLAGDLQVVSGTLERLRSARRAPAPGDLVLEGSVRADGDQVEVTLRLSVLDQGRPLWSHRFIFPPPGEADPWCDRRIVAHLVERLTGEALPLARSSGGAGD